MREAIATVGLLKIKGGPEDGPPERALLIEAAERQHHRTIQFFSFHPLFSKA
jgi:hypothetical protein